MNFIAILLGIGCVGGLGIYTAGSLAKKEAEVALKLMCEGKKETLDSIFHGVEQSVSLAVQQATAELDAHGRVEIDDDYTEHMWGLFGNIASNTEGAVSYYLRYNPELAGPTAGFFWSKEKGEEAFCEYECTDLSAYEKDDLEHVGWYYLPVEAGTALWIEPYENRNNDMFMCSYATPFYDEGQLIGVIGIDIDIEQIMGMVNESNVYTTGFGYLINAEGQIVYHDDYISGETRPEVSAEAYEYEMVLDNGLILVMNVSKDEVYSIRNSLIRSIALCAVVSLLACCIFTVWLTSRINHVAYRDSLTGIRNVTAYKEQVEALETKMKNGYSNFGVIALDTNGLKIINDQYGHEAGDGLLIGATRLICSVFKHSPVFRTGGDEFTVILEGLDYQNREQLLEQLAEDMQHAFFEYQGEKFPIEIAKGMATCRPNVDTDYAQIYKRADDAMYIDKARMKAEKMETS